MALTTLTHLKLYIYEKIERKQMKISLVITQFRSNEQKNIENNFFFSLSVLHNDTLSLFFPITYPSCLDCFAKSLSISSITIIIIFIITEESYCLLNNKLTSLSFIKIALGKRESFITFANVTCRFQSVVFYH